MMSRIVFVLLVACLCIVPVSCIAAEASAEASSEIQSSSAAMSKLNKLAALVEAKAASGNKVITFKKIVAKSTLASVDTVYFFARQNDRQFSWNIPGLTAGKTWNFGGSYVYSTRFELTLSVNGQNFLKPDDEDLDDDDGDHSKTFSNTFNGKKVEYKVYYEIDH